jgi:hypothetical protein
MEQTYRIDQTSRLSRNERMLLLLPLAASAFVGLFQLLLPALLASLSGYSGNDIYIYRISGAATFGYAGALALALRQNEWQTMRLVIIAFFTFGLASLYACGADIVSGSARPVVYVVLVLTVVFVAITGTLLYTHRGASKGSPDTAHWIGWFLVIATVLAAIFGLFPLFLPNFLNPLFSLKGTDVFIFRQAGAATLGYVIMGVFELRSRNWQEIRWPLVMAGIFNGLAFISSLVSFVVGGPFLLSLLVAPASLAVTIAVVIAMSRRGQ